MVFSRINLAEGITLSTDPAIAGADNHWHCWVWPWRHLNPGPASVDLDVARTKGEWSVTASVPDLS